MIELTEEHTSILKQGYPVRLAVPQLGGDVILLFAAPQENTTQVLQEAVQDIREQQAWREAALKTAAKWAQENGF